MTEHSQLEALALNYLRNQDISAIPSRIPKLNPCSICQKAILTHRFQSFVVLDCEYLFHRKKKRYWPLVNITFGKKQTDSPSDEALMRALGFMKMALVLDKGVNQSKSLCRIRRQAQS
ncbi:1529_t:CDS:2 [Funneliformis geosporum]|uniref:1529_t:CDS:1 n=1 Tax=Funneliformis geosporum TaxID=1117311 RepID=A0A9W4ST40_9GLOM|nr:1529_t:CDS:2 [Funneliformis geosporum]